MRLALFSDIHGNPIALDAVLAELKHVVPLDGYIVLGDLANGGYDPAGVIERLVALAEQSTVWFVRGNGEHMLTAGGLEMALDELRGNPSEAARRLDAACTYVWSYGYLAGHGEPGLEWLRGLPVEQRLTLPDGTRLLAVHAAPGHDGSESQQRTITPDRTDDELRALIAGCAADLVCVGHTHWPLDRLVDGVRIVNVGSVSSPWSADLRASYVLIDAAEDGYRVEHRRVAYDVSAVLDAFYHSGMPTAHFASRNFRGEVDAPWPTEEAIHSPPS